MSSGLGHLVTPFMEFTTWARFQCEMTAAVVHKFPAGLVAAVKNIVKLLELVVVCSQEVLSAKIRVAQLEPLVLLQAIMLMLSVRYII